MLVVNKLHVLVKKIDNVGCRSKYQIVLLLKFFVYFTGIYLTMSQLNSMYQMTWYRFLNHPHLSSVFNTDLILLSLWLFNATFNDNLSFIV